MSSEFRYPLEVEHVSHRHLLGACASCEDFDDAMCHLVTKHGGAHVTVGQAHTAQRDWPTHNRLSDTARVLRQMGCGVLSVDGETTVYGNGSKDFL